MRKCVVAESGGIHYAILRTLSHNLVWINTGNYIGGLTHANTSQSTLRLHFGEETLLLGVQWSACSIA